MRIGQRLIAGGAGILMAVVTEPIEKRVGLLVDDDHVLSRD